MAVKNMWTACISVFRCLATFKPIRFRSWLTRRFQLCSFAVLLIVAAIAGPGVFIAWRVAAGGSVKFLVSVVLPLTRTPQTYLPVPLILLASCVTAAKLAIAGANQPGETAAAAAAAAADPANPAAASATITATRIVLVLAAIFIVFELPGAIFVTFELYRLFPDWMVPLNDLLVTVDSATSFFVFFAFSTNFRRHVSQVLRRRPLQVPPSFAGGLGFRAVNLRSERPASQSFAESPQRRVLTSSPEASHDERLQALQRHQLLEAPNSPESAILAEASDLNIAGV